MQCNDVGYAELQSNFSFEAMVVGRPYIIIKVLHADRTVKVTKELYAQLSDPHGTSNVQGTFVNKNGELILDGREDSEYVYEYTGTCDDDPSILVFTKLEAAS